MARRKQGERIKFYLTKIIGFDKVELPQRGFKEGFFDNKPSTFLVSPSLRLKRGFPINEEVEAFG